MRCSLVCSIAHAIFFLPYFLTATCYRALFCLSLSLSLVIHVLTVCFLVTHSTSTTPCTPQPPPPFHSLFSEDGGVIENLNVDSAVQRCRELVSDLSDITVDIILSSGKDIDVVDASKFTTLKVLERNWAIFRYDSSMRLVNEARQAYPEVNFRYLVYPSQKIPGAFNFSSPALKEFVAVGLQDGKNAVLNNMSQ
jgi:hypothetical protein